MDEEIKLHSVKVDKDKCIGCIKCMKVCPTKAIRVKERKAVINYERCIDCGECLRVCPYDAIVPITTSSADINQFEYKVAIPSPVIYSQFGHDTTPNEILASLKEIGFDQVYDEALVCEMSSIAIEEYMDTHNSPRPVISSTCPVVVRLIQRLFPGLCDLIIPIEPPREIAAKYLKKEISEEQNIPEEKIGVINITPCSAKMISINRPETMEKSYLDGAISIRNIYNEIMQILKKGEHKFSFHKQTRISGIGIGWAISGGEIRGLEYQNSVSVSGVDDTIKILEDIESGQLKGIEYLEALICPEGCIGGPLTVESRFIAKSNILKLRRTYGDKKRVDSSTVKKLYDEDFFSFESEVKPKPFEPIAKDRSEAIKKIKLRQEIKEKLPMIDCGICGSPDCATFAEDVARGVVKVQDCSFVENENKKGD